MRRGGREGSQSVHTHTRRWMYYARGLSLSVNVRFHDLVKCWVKLRVNSATQERWAGHVLLSWSTPCFVSNCQHSIGTFCWPHDGLFTFRFRHKSNLLSGMWSYRTNCFVFSVRFVVQFKSAIMQWIIIVISCESSNWKTSLPSEEIYGIRLYCLQFFTHEINILEATTSSDCWLFKMTYQGETRVKRSFRKSCIQC